MSVLNALAEVGRQIEPVTPGKSAAARTAMFFSISMLLEKNSSVVITNTFRMTPENMLLDIADTTGVRTKDAQDMQGGDIMMEDLPTTVINQELYEAGSEDMDSFGGGDDAPLPYGYDHGVYRDPADIGASVDGVLEGVGDFAMNEDDEQEDAIQELTALIL